jgi:hypothetical protein
MSSCSAQTPMAQSRSSMLFPSVRWNRPKLFLPFLFVAASILLVWMLADWIVAGSAEMLIMGAMGIALLIIGAATLANWRIGVFVFILWLLFEDLPRKYLGNGFILFFGKDVLAAITYLSLWRAKRRHDVPWFRPPFIVPLALFFLLASVQIFNTWTPSVLYGFLGLKLYFYYFPLIFAGYALIRNGKDLEQLLVYNLALGSLIALLGIIQSIAGLKFLNPLALAPELEGLGNLTRYSPITHQAVPQPTSVFVSAGRFASYLILVVILALGAQAYLFLTSRRRAVYGFVALGLGVVATVQSGSRGGLIYVTISVLVLSAGFLWGAPWRWSQGRALVKAMRRAFLVSAAGLFLMIQFFPGFIGANWAFYSETLSPSSSASELRDRTWVYPLHNLITALQHPRWLYGDGTGTASLGMQYVAKVLGQAPISFWVENGWGTLILEMGILGPILWIIWTSSLLYFSWKIVRQVRGTIYFPVALSIFWYAFLLLVPLSYNGMPPYQNYVMNAYLWLLIGVLFRLPHLTLNSQTVPRPVQVSKLQPATAYAGGV